MRLRTYLILSYLAVIALLTVGLWALSDRLMNRLALDDLQVADAGINQVADANAKVSEAVLTRVGEYIVQDKAGDVARELAYVLAGQKTFNYAQMRRNPRLRQIAVQEIFTPQGPAGYTDLYDTKGEIIFHPDRRAEGQNQLAYRGSFPEARELLQQSLKENVSGYYISTDARGKERKRYGVRLHIKGTPFIVSAVVNIDEFFTPTRERIKATRQVILAKAEQDMQKHHAANDLRIKIHGFVAGALVCLIGALFGVWFAATISQPISRLRDGVRQVGEGDFAVSVPEKGVREVIHLAQAFNRLGQQLIEYIQKRDFIRDTFGRYVTQEVVKKLLEDKTALEMGGEIREVSLIMSDLRGFTAITAGMDPEKVITFLNRYLGKMIEILLDYRAVIDEILGDGILAFFGAPEPLDNHPAQAVACALKMQAAMSEINALNEADGMPHLEMGIGVNTGTVVVGNIGSEKRTKYSVVGSHVNFASRMEAFALPGQVLISAATYERVKDLVEVREGVKVEMKGVPEPALLYNVVAITGPYNIRLPERDENLTLLAQPLSAELYRLQDKIVAGAPGATRITHLGATAARVELTGELKAWEDVRLNLLDERHQKILGDIYGKVTQVQALEAGRLAANISFTSVAPEVLQVIDKIVPAV